MLLSLGVPSGALCLPSSTRLCCGCKLLVQHPSSIRSVAPMASWQTPRQVAAAASASGVQEPPPTTQQQQPAVSQRVRATDAPCIVKTKALVATTEGTLSLAQGKRCSPAHPPAFARSPALRPLPRRLWAQAGLPHVLLTVIATAGIVHWQPPAAALALAAQMAGDPAVSQYGPDEGLPALREALRRKIREENGLHGVRRSKGCRCCGVAVVK